MSPALSLIQTLPPELIALIFCHLASYPLDPNRGLRENHSILLPFSKTCRMCYKVFNESRYIWTALFRTTFDLHPHHIEGSYSIQEEYKRRFHMLNDICRWKLRGGRFPTRHAHVELLETLAFEHREHNFTHFKRSPGVPSFLRRELLSLLKFLKSMENDPVPQTRMPLSYIRKWIVIFVVIGMSDREMARYLISHSPSRDQVCAEISRVFRNPEQHLPTIENAQRAQIAILQILCSSEPILIKPFPRFTPSWFDLLDMGKGGVALRPVQMPQPSALCGSWAGYYTLHRTNQGRLLSFTLTSRPYSDPGMYCTLLAEDGLEESHTLTFVLSGRISLDGRALVNIMYTDANWGGEVTFSGFILPWGIAGTYLNGLFWLWKVPEKEEKDPLVGAMGSVHL